ncbi:MAG: hypothetical protein Q8L48_19550 [Archangium sp.]|nr:hypothetical protein [Archangium sp.]
MKRGLVAALLLLTLAGVTTAMSRRERPVAPEPPRDDARAAKLQAAARVIFITLDGPLRDDVLSGPHMRGLQEAVRSGGLAFPADAASSMALSLPGYQAMAAGTLTSCNDNDCGRITVETMAERVAHGLHLGPDDVAVFASWSRLALAVTSRDGVAYVDAPEDGPKREGGPPWRNARYDEETFGRAREYWEKHHPRFLHLALLDTDEWAHQGLRPEYEQALRETDARVVEVLRWVSELPAEEAALTTVVLASDHGRGYRDWREHGIVHPGSGEIFIAAIGPLVQRGEPGAADQRDLRPTVERLFGLCPRQVEDDGRAIEAIMGELPCLPSPPPRGEGGR